MKRVVFIAASAMGVAFAQSVLAADLPVRAAPAYQASVVVAPTWTGLYLGLNGGWGWTSSNDVTITPVGAAAGAFPPFSLGQRTNGAVFGGQLGYNYQTGSWVFGIEGDVDGFGSQNSFKSVFQPAVTSVFSASASPNWLATVRGRLGYTWGPGLIYVTGGGAWTSVQFDTNDAGVTSGSFSTTRSGWTLGAGYEWMFAPNWSLRAEYLYYGFTGTVNNTLALPVAVAGPGAGVSHSWANMNTSVVRFGLDYKFDWGGRY